MKKRVLLLMVVAVLFFCLSDIMATQLTEFSGIEVRTRDPKKYLVWENKSGDLLLDDINRQVIIKSKKSIWEIKYDDIQQVILETTSHMRGGSGGMGAIASMAKMVTDHWCLFEFRKADGSLDYCMVNTMKNTGIAGHFSTGAKTDRFVQKIVETFGDKVVIPNFTEEKVKVEKKSLADFKAAALVKVDGLNQPIPEIQPDKALLVVACPLVYGHKPLKGATLYFYANGKMVAANKEGTYSFGYVDPGEYLLVSQCEDAEGLRMTLEAGKEYYFLQDIFMGWMKANTELTRHSKEFVRFEISAMYHMTLSMP